MLFLFIPKASQWSALQASENLLKRLNSFSIATKQMSSSMVLTTPTILAHISVGQYSMFCLARNTAHCPGLDFDFNLSLDVLFLGH